MENSKKKRSEVKSDGRTSGKKIKAKKERYNGGVTAEDAELEEFLAILKRLQAGFNQFQNKDAGGRLKSPAATDSGSLNPAFELEDFIQFNDGRLKTSNGDVLQNDNVSGFDLNADPASDQVSD